MGKSWSESEDKLLRFAIKNGNRPKEIAMFLGRTEKSVECRASRLELKVNDKEKRPAKKFSLVDVKCPFFERFYRGKSIKCEGLKKHSYLINGFVNEGAWVDFVNRNCNENWQACPISKMLQGKYEKE